jgi:hypothetical protein
MKFMNSFTNDNHERVCLETSKHSMNIMNSLTNDSDLSRKAAASSEENRLVGNEAELKAATPNRRSTPRIGEDYRTADAQRESERDKAKRKERKRTTRSVIDQARSSEVERHIASRAASQLKA